MLLRGSNLLYIRAFMPSVTLGTKCNSHRLIYQILYSRNTRLMYCHRELKLSELSWRTSLTLLTPCGVIDIQKGKRHGEPGSSSSQKMEPHNITKVYYQQPIIIFSDWANIKGEGTKNQGWVTGISSCPRDYILHSNKIPYAFMRCHGVA